MSHHMLSNRLGRLAAMTLMSAIYLSQPAFAADKKDEKLPDPVTLTIVHFNDIDRINAQKGQGGIAKLATIVKQERARNSNILVTHGGDTISPSLLSGFDKGAHMIDLLNKLDIDMMALGNHEFDFGPAVAVERIKEAKFPMLSNNAIDPDGTLVDGVTENLMFTFGDYKVGFFGLTTVSTAVKSSPKPVTFKPATDIAQQQVSALKAQGANMVFALAHTNISEDQDLEKQGIVDFVLSGDDHDLRLHYNGKTGLLESSSQANFVTVIDFKLWMAKGRKGPKFKWTPTFRVINTDTVEPDPEFTKHVKVYLDQLSEKLDVKIGTTDVALDSRRSTVRGQENALSNMIIDAMREAVQADIAITNGGGIRADREYEAGSDLTRRDIQSELPFGNRTILIEISGTDIVAALENGVSQVEKGAGRFPHVSGISFKFDRRKAAGQRVSDVKVAGKAIDLKKSYKLATNDYMGRGGDGYKMFAGQKRLIDENASSFMASQVMDYIAAKGKIAPKVENRVVEIK